MDKILNSIKTQQQFDLFTTFLNTLNANLYKSDDSFDKTLSENKSKEGQLLVTELSKPEVIGSPEEKEKLLRDLGLQLKNLKTIYITVPIPITAKLTNAISKWSDKNLKGNYLFNMDYDPSILGGAQISIDGKYMDDSLIKRVESIFKTKQEEIMTISNG